LTNTAKSLSNNPHLPSTSITITILPGPNKPGFPLLQNLRDHSYATISEKSSATLREK
jgi:hypothetical protein